MAKQVHDDQKFTGIRLPLNVKPINYDLKLKPDLEKFKFSGNVAINYVAKEVPECIILHANELEITGGHIGENPLTVVTYSQASETATLEFQESIAPNGLLSLDFQGVLNDKMKGFYRTAFKLDDQTVNAATTQFEATDARRCFPCWDEPAIKAKFSVSLTFPKWEIINNKKYERLALSNMPEESRSESGDEVVVRFKESVVMSTYLLAFIVGPFEAIEGADMRRPVRVFTTPGKKEQGRFALEVACKALPYYEDYFGIKYPLPKMDLIAIPDFLSGAMENWGLVTYRETCLLVDPKNTTTARKQWIALVVAHELAHQWFGNLVTMEWWTHLWLNEGFASFMEYLCVDHIFPEYDIWSQFITDSYGLAMDLDSLHNSHPIEVPVNHPSEIDEIFDDISYNKGASVIRMLYNYIGDDSFRKGMKEYLTKFEYKNATTEDLWDSLEAASNKPVRRLMSGWTSQKGYPLLSLGYAMDGDSAKLTVTQTKFNLNGVVRDEDSEMKWMIPISVITGRNATKAEEICLLEEKTKDITIEGVGDSWVKLNPGTIGLYRIAYPASMNERLWPAIANRTLPPMDRLGLQNDFYALCQAGKMTSVDFLKLMQAFKGETIYTVWNSIDRALGRLNILLANTDYQAEFHAYGRDLYSDIFKRLTWSPKPGESHTDALTRTLIIDRLVSFGDQAVIAEARRRFRAHLDKTDPIPADLRGACYKAASAYGDKDDFESLISIYRTAELQEEKNRVARAMGYTKDTARLTDVIAFAFSEEVRNQDRVFMIMPIGVSNPPIAWKALQDNKDFLRRTYGSGHLIARIVKCSTENFTSEDKAQEVTKFFEANKFPGAERTIQQSVETIRLNASWLSRDADTIKAFLASYA